ncbi:MAG TPA: palindromic element RPE4 domain-containing protein [Rickettsia endosymbiont of Bembidion nr. Transversale]|nr:palindromic element RPE4 domain-containing protein [Rickettsia endosymbiont of Bembidion nr. Transversale]
MKSSILSRFMLDLVPKPRDDRSDT